MMQVRLWFLVVSLGLSSAMFAQPGSIDPTFGVGGIVTTDVSSGGDVARDGLILSDGRIIICGATNSFGSFLMIRYHNDGSVDSSFGNHGIVTTIMGGTGAEATGMVRQSDGKLVLAGSFASGGSSFSAVARYDSNGVLDGSFGTNGKAVHDIGIGGDVKDVLLQPDGKIIAAGTFRSGSTLFMGLRRYKTNGTLDSTFGFNGTVTRGPGVENRCFGIALQSDGKIVGAGITDQGAGYNFLVFRFKPSGSPDSTFGTVGRVITSVSVFPSFGADVAVLPDSQIVVAGYAGAAANLTHKYAVVRYNPLGTPDSTFGTAGIALTPEIGITTGFAFLNRMLMLNSGKILLTGQGTNLGTSDDFAVARMKANGAIDSTFGTNGIVYTNITSNGRDIPYRLLHQPDGNIIAIGQGGTGVFVGGPQVTLVRYINDELPTAVNPKATLPNEFRIEQNYPNPFNPSSKIKFRIPHSAYVTLTVYDILGRMVATLVNGEMQPGNYETVFNAGGLSSGVYLCRLTAASFVQTKKMILMR